VDEILQEEINLTASAESVLAALVAMRSHAEQHQCGLCERNMEVLYRAMIGWLKRDEPEADPFAMFNPDP
jgi:hypothetical protein